MILISAILDKMTSLKDKCWKLYFETNELSPDVIKNTSSMLKEFCYIAIKSEDFNASELHDLDTAKAEYDTGKSPAQRLRAVFYRLWEMDREGYEDFNMYYSFKMEKLINHYKKLLDEKQT